jgi:hypothetical protein
MWIEHIAPDLTNRSISKKFDLLIFISLESAYEGLSIYLCHFEKFRLFDWLINKTLAVYRENPVLEISRHLAIDRFVKFWLAKQLDAYMRTNIVRANRSLSEPMLGHESGVDGQG